MKYVLTIASVSLLLFAGQACSVRKGREISERAVEQFHARLSAGQCREIYAESDEGFRKKTTEAQMLALCEDVRQRLGVVKSTKQKEWSVNSTPAGDVATLTYETEFAQGKAVEHFVWVIKGEKTLLFQYNVENAK